MTSISRQPLARRFSRKPKGSPKPEQPADQSSKGQPSTRPALPAPSRMLSQPRSSPSDRIAQHRDFSIRSAARWDFALGLARREQALNHQQASLSERELRWCISRHEHADFPLQQARIIALELEIAVRMESATCRERQFSSIVKINDNCMQILHEMSDAINESGYAKLINGIASARRARRKTGQSPRQLNRDRLTAASEKHTAGGANKTESNEPLRHQGHRSASFGAHDQSEELNAGLDHTMARLEMQKEEIRVLLKGMKPS